MTGQRRTLQAALPLLGLCLAFVLFLAAPSVTHAALQPVLRRSSPGNDAPARLAPDDAGPSVVPSATPVPSELGTHGLPAPSEPNDQQAQTDWQPCATPSGSPTPVFYGAHCPPIGTGWCTLLTDIGGEGVYSNGGNAYNACSSTYGYKFQCVELVQRFYARRWGYPLIWWWVTYASQMFNNTSNLGDVTAIPNGGSPAPVWGDVLVFGSTAIDDCATGVGHVALVTGVQNGSVSFVEQNWSTDGKGSLAISAGNQIAARGTYYVRGWLHSAKNGEGPGPTLTPTKTPITPTGSQVKLWSQANFQGSVVWSGGVGYSDGPSGNAMSMEVPAGWSVKTWRADNHGGGEPRCWTGSVSNLQDHSWQNAIQAIEPFDHNACPTPTNTPITPVPSGWSVKYFADLTCTDRTCNTTPKCTEPNLPGPFIDKTWTSAPCQGVGMGNTDWGALFTGRFDFAPGNYVFHAEHDDGVKI